MAGFRSPLWLLGVSGAAAPATTGGVTSLLAPWAGGAGSAPAAPGGNGGITSLLAPWAGGASAPPVAPGGNGGYVSLLAPWMGGASGQAFVPPEPEPEGPPQTLGGRGRQDLDPWTLHRQREETQDALLRWRESLQRTEPQEAPPTPASPPPTDPRNPRKGGNEGFEGGDAAAAAAMVPMAAAPAPPLRAAALEAQIVVPAEVARAASRPAIGLDLLTLAALLAAADDDD